MKTSFALYYVSDAVGQAFEDFYQNTHGLADAFNAFWLSVATYFANNQFVLSYELLNEVRCNWSCLSCELACELRLHPHFFCILALSSGDVREK